VLRDTSDNPWVRRFFGAKWLPNRRNRRQAHKPTSSRSLFRHRRTVALVLLLLILGLASCSSQDHDGTI
jgi:hypothetical protein